MISVAVRDLIKQISTNGHLHANSLCLVEVKQALYLSQASFLRLGVCAKRCYKQLLLSTWCPCQEMQQAVAPVTGATACRIYWQESCLLGVCAKRCYRQLLPSTCCPCQEMLQAVAPVYLVSVPRDATGSCSRLLGVRAKRCYRQLLLSTWCPCQEMRQAVAPVYLVSMLRDATGSCSRLLGVRAKRCDKQG